MLNTGNKTALQREDEIVDHVLCLFGFDSDNG